MYADMEANLLPHHNPSLYIEATPKWAVGICIFAYHRLPSQQARGSHLTNFNITYSHPMIYSLKNLLLPFPSLCESFQ